MGECRMSMSMYASAELWGSSVGRRLCRDDLMDAWTCSVTGAPGS